LGEGEELVAHVGIGVGYWVVRSVDGAAEDGGTGEAWLGGKSFVPVIAV